MIAKLEQQLFSIQFVSGIVGLFLLFNRYYGFSILKAVCCHHNVFETGSSTDAPAATFYSQKLA